MFGLGKYSSGGRLVVLVRRGACDMGPNLGHVHVRANRRRGDWHGGLWMLLLGGLPGQSQKPDAGGSLPRTDRPHHRAMVIHGCSVDGASLNGRNLSFRSGNDQSRSASVTWPCNARSVEMPSHAPASPVRGSVGNGVVFRIARPRSCTAPWGCAPAKSGSGKFHVAGLSANRRADQPGAFLGECTRSGCAPTATIFYSP